MQLRTSIALTLVTAFVVAMPTATAPIGECVNAAVPVCLWVTYHPSDNSCGLAFTIGANQFKQGFPAAPALNLHAQHPPPYSLNSSDASASTLADKHQPSPHGGVLRHGHLSKWRANTDEARSQPA